MIWGRQEDRGALWPPVREGGPGPCGDPGSAPCHRGISEDQRGRLKDPLRTVSLRFGSRRPRKGGTGAASILRVGPEADSLPRRSDPRHLPAPELHKAPGAPHPGVPRPALHRGRRPAPAVACLEPLVSPPLSRSDATGRGETPHGIHVLPCGLVVHHPGVRADRRRCSLAGPRSPPAFLVPLPLSPATTAFAGAIIAAVTECLPLPLDDNITIPLAAGISLTLFHPM